MKQHEYNEMWKKILRPTQEVAIEELGLNSTFPQQDIYKAYEFFKNNHKSTDMRNPDKLLDRHKIASCITHAIIKVAPFPQKNLSKTAEFQHRTVNYSVGISSGLDIMFDMIKSDAKENQDSLKYSIFDQFVRYPKPADDNRNYMDYLVKALARAHYNKEVNITLLAHIYFFIEKYHEEVIRNEQLSLVNET